MSKKELPKGKDAWYKTLWYLFRLDSFQRRQLRKKYPNDNIGTYYKNRHDIVPPIYNMERRSFLYMPIN